MHPNNDIFALFLPRDEIFLILRYYEYVHNTRTLLHFMHKKEAGNFIQNDVNFLL